MLIVTQAQKMEYVGGAQIIEAMRHARSIAHLGGFILLEKSERNFIQGLPLAHGEHVPLGADSACSWYIERPLNGRSRYVTSCSEEHALNIFKRFADGEDWRGLADWKFVSQKENPLKLTKTEADALLGLMTQLRQDSQASWGKTDLERFLHETEQGLRKQMLSEGAILVVGPYLGSFLNHGRAAGFEPLKRVYAKCKERAPEI